MPPNSSISQIILSMTPFKSIITHQFSNHSPLSTWAAIYPQMELTLPEILHLNYLKSIWQFPPLNLPNHFYVSGNPSNYFIMVSCFHSIRIIVRITMKLASIN
eukprot:NODE_711_length_4530_cov_1.118935.p5 type:complete len:103 gc:universal NODE_711_length_4530_cov_1.118935:3475-3783(+)